MPSIWKKRKQLHLTSNNWKQITTTTYGVGNPVSFTLNSIIIFCSPNIPRDYLNINGGVVLLSVFDYDKIGNDDFAGEVVIHLSSIPKITMSETVDSTSVVMMALHRPWARMQGPFQVITEKHLLQ